MERSLRGYRAAVSVATRAWIGAHRLRRRLQRAAPDREQLVREYAPGRSWLDVGCMWSVHGRICFVAEEAGATQVTGVDLMAETARFRAEHERRGSHVRFVQGDLHDPSILERAGTHDVVWSSGVLYHAPHPIQTLERLRAVTGQLLILSTEALPELPWARGAAILYPALGDGERRAYAGAPGGEAVGVTTPYDPEQGYANWFWGITPSALDGMLRVAGFDVLRELRASPFHVTVVARPR
jgi:hypothetical protein